MNKSRTSVYVAGASSEREHRAKPVMAALMAASDRYVVTHDWTEGVDLHGANNEYGHLSEAELADFAYEDLMGVRASDVLVVLAPDKPSTGVWVELGVALALRLTVLIAGKCDQCIFTHLPRCKKFDTDAELIEYMLGDA